MLAWLTLGDAAAITVGLVVLAGTGIAAWRAGPVAGRLTIVALSLVLVGSLGITAYGAFQLIVALGGTGSGQAAPPDAAALARADGKIAATEGQMAFRLVLSEPELNALLQDTLPGVGTPFRSVRIDILNAVGEPGLIGFVGEFKNGSLDVDGTLSAVVNQGSLELEIIEAGAGIFTMPSFAREAVADMISTVADFESALAAEGADVQDIVIGDDRVVVTGVNRAAGTVDALSVLAGIESQIGPTVVAPVDAPGFGPGRALEAKGERYYVALGDSLGAGVGATDPRYGYVPRFHTWLETATGGELGLRNLSEPGETSGGLLWDGQLGDALLFISSNPVDVITVNIGANDLLGHLAAPDCSDNIEGVACRQRVDAALATYEKNIEVIFKTLRDAAPQTRILFLTSYNPFSLGFADRVRFEGLSNQAVAMLNELAIAAAAAYDIEVADGFEPMRGTTTATTHMVDSPPDIHPNELGYDILTGALVSAAA